MPVRSRGSKLCAAPAFGGACAVSAATTRPGLQVNAASEAAKANVARIFPRSFAHDDGGYSYSRSLAISERCLQDQNRITSCGKSRTSHGRKQRPLMAGRGGCRGRSTRLGSPRGEKRRRKTNNKGVIHGPISLIMVADPRIGRDCFSGKLDRPHVSAPPSQRLCEITRGGRRARCLALDEYSNGPVPRALCQYSGADEAAGIPGEAQARTGAVPDACNGQRSWNGQAFDAVVRLLARDIAFLRVCGRCGAFRRRTIHGRVQICRRRGDHGIWLGACPPVDLVPAKRKKNRQMISRSVCFSNV